MAFSNIKVIEPPAVLPVSRTEVKDLLHYQDSDEDALIDSLTRGAVSAVETHLNTSLITRKLQETFTLERGNAYGYYEDHLLPFGFVQDIESFQYYPDRGTENIPTELADIEEYQRNDDLVRFKVPRFDFLRPDSFQIVYNSGYGDSPNDVPEDIKVCIKQIVTFNFNNHTSNIHSSVQLIRGLPPHVLHTLDVHRRY